MIQNYEKFKEAVQEHGELHANVAEWGDVEVEIRLGQVTWHDDAEAFTLSKFGEKYITLRFEDISAPYKPQQLKHE